MADDDNGTNEQCELVLAYENMLDMFAESYSYSDTSFDAYAANDQTLDDAVFRWWGPQVLLQQDIALRERGTRALERATDEAARDLWDVFTGILHRYNANSTSESEAAVERGSIGAAVPQTPRSCERQRTRTQRRPSDRT